MMEIEALRQLADDKTDPEEFENTKRKLMEAYEKIEKMEGFKSQGGQERNRFDQ